MIDIRRWVLAEAWLANGLRLEWSAYDHRLDAARWVTPNSGGRPYYYRGRGVWVVMPEPTGIRTSWERAEAPSMSTDDMQHELAHWLGATADERDQENFGHAANARTPEGDENEERALRAEKVIESIIAASARIASMALGAKP